MAGRSARRAVTQNKSTGRWKAAVRYDRRQIDLGTYETEYEAIVAFNHASYALFGQGAHLIPTGLRYHPKPGREEQIKADVAARLSAEL